MLLLNRPSEFASHLYDEDGRLIGGLAGLEALGRVVSMGVLEGEGEEGGDGEMTRWIAWIVSRMKTRSSMRTVQLRKRR
jgi:hypothetical protein